MKSLLRIFSFGIALTLLTSLANIATAQVNITNYNFTPTAGTFTALTGGTALGISYGNNDEDAANFVPIGFDFWYMGAKYTQVSASTNGFLRLGNGAGNISDSGGLTFHPANNLTSDDNRPILAPLWDDLKLGTWSYQLQGTAPNRVFVFEFKNMFWDKSSATASISFQVQLSENTGQVSFVYDSSLSDVPHNGSGGASIGITGLNTGSGNFRSLGDTGTTPTASSTAETSNLSARPTNGRTYSFTPTTVAAPTNLTFSDVYGNAMILNWTDNSTDETGFVVYQATSSSGPYTYVATTAANATSYSATGLNNTTYYWRVFALRETLSTALSGNRATSGTLVFDWNGSVDGSAINPQNWTPNTRYPNTNEVIRIGNQITFSSPLTSSLGGARDLILGGMQTTNLSFGSSNLTVSNTLTINSGSTINMGIGKLLGVTSTAGTGELQTQNTTGTAIPSGITWSFTVKYNAATAAQTVVKGSYTGLTMSGNGIKTFATGPTSVAGNWNSSGGNIDLNTYNLTLNFNGTTAQTIDDATANGVLFQAINFTGAGSKTFNTGNKYSVSSNWNSTGGKVSFAPNTGITFNSGSAQNLVDASSDGGNGVVFNNVTFGTGGKIMSGAGKFSVAGSGILTMVAFATLQTGNMLWLKSADGLTATVAAMSTYPSITGTVYVERFMKGNDDKARRGYRLMSSPTHDAVLINKYSIGYLKQTMYITGNFDALPYDPNDLTKFDNSPNHNPTIFHYKESNLGGISTNDYTPITSIASDYFNNAEGMYVFYRGKRTLNDGSGTSRFLTSVKPEDNAIVFKGLLNQGSFPVALSFTASTPTNYADGFNLVGNPYPSTIDLLSADMVYSANLTPFVYVLDPTTKAFGVFDRTGGFAATGDASRYIASGQGFFVKATSNASPSVTFKEDAKVNQQLLTLGSTPRLLMGTSPVKGTVPQMLKMMMINQVDSNAQDDIVIRFDDNGKEKFDEQEDAFDMGGNGTTFLSSYSSDNVRLAINSYAPIKKGTKVGLSVISTLSGDFNLEVSNLKSLDKKFDAYLVDNYKADTVKLSTQPTYAFKVDRSVAATYTDGRFELIFDEKPLVVNTVFNFYGKGVTDHINVGWKVDDNPKQVMFTLEKSIDNVNFYPLTTFPSDSRSVYGYLDKQPNVGDNYYRLLQTDVNGQSKYSDIIDVKYTSLSFSNSGVIIYPVPVTNRVNIVLNKNYDSATYVRVLDLFGQVVLKTSFTGTNASIDFERFTPSVYIIELTNANKIISRSKFIKQ